MEYPRTVEEIAADYNQRRAGILKALTEEVDDFYPLCDPSKVRLLHSSCREELGEPCIRDFSPLSLSFSLAMITG
jgi:hypothetical protein